MRSPISRSGLKAFGRCLLGGWGLACLHLSCAWAFPIWEAGSLSLQGSLESGIGVFHNSQDYRAFGQPRGAVDWQEGYWKWGLEGTASQGWYARLSGIASATFGKGDAGGFTTGRERRWAWEDAVIGWKNDFLDLSVGGQNFVMGDGFLIAGDVFNLGQGIPGTYLDRGGAYWLAPRKAFRHSVILRLHPKSSWQAEGFWLRSDNPAQASTSLAGVHGQWRLDGVGSLGVAFFDVLGVDEREFFGLLRNRKRMQVYNLHAKGSLGIDGLSLAVGYVSERFQRIHNRAKAWYAGAEYALPGFSFSPVLHYRYSWFDMNYDPLFYGFVRYGTWFQGEVGGNYTGPFNSNAGIHEFGVRLDVGGGWQVGALHVISNTAVPSAAAGGKRYALEFNIYAERSVGEHLWVSPLLGRYWPAAGFPGLHRSSVYGQCVAILNY